MRDKTVTDTRSAGYFLDVFIELTDHLRCPADHTEQFLVLLPDAMEGRAVLRGTLGCPVCGRVIMVEDGEVDFGGRAPGPAPTTLTADAIAAFLGLQGPGGHLALIGGAAVLAEPLCDLLPRVHVVAVNPPLRLTDGERLSVVRGDRLPLKSASMRGVVVAADHALAEWIERAARVVLPGNRIVVEGPRLSTDRLELLGEAAGVWVGRRPTASLHQP